MLAYVSLVHAHVPKDLNHNMASAMGLVRLRDTWVCKHHIGSKINKRNNNFFLYHWKD